MNRACWVTQPPWGWKIGRSLVRGFFLAVERRLPDIREMQEARRPSSCCLPTCDQETGCIPLPRLWWSQAPSLTFWNAVLLGRFWPILELHQLTRQTFLCLLVGRKSHTEKLLWGLVVPGSWCTATDWSPSFTIMIIRNSLLGTFPLVLSSRMWLSRLLNTQLIALTTGCSFHLPLIVFLAAPFFIVLYLTASACPPRLNSLSSHWSLCDD